MARFIVLLICLLLPFTLMAGLTFEKTFGGNGSDAAHDVVELSGGNLLLIGSTTSFNGTGTDGYLVAVQPDGQMVWERNFDQGNYEQFRGGVALPDGGAIVVGSTRTADNAPSDVLLVRYDQAGTAQWVRTYGGADADGAMKIAATPDGAYIIAGSTESYGAGAKAIWVLKIDAAGDTLWTRTFGGSRDDYAQGCAVDPQGHIFISGDSFFLFSPDMYLLKLNPDGSTAWIKTFSTSGWTEGYDVCLGQQGPVFAGYGYWGGGYGHDMLLVFLDQNGDTLNTAHAGGISDDYAFGICHTSDGGFLAAGKSISFGNGWQGLLWKVDANGTTLWQKAWGGSGEDILFSVIEDGNHFYVAAGQSYRGSVAGWDAYLVKTDSLGELSPIGGTKPPLAQSCRLGQNYPNPFNPSTLIPFHLNRPGTVTIEMTDAPGRLVARLGQRLFPAGDHTLRWDGRGQNGERLTSGLYFYRLKFNGKPLGVGKMLLLR